MAFRLSAALNSDGLGAKLHYVNKLVEYPGMICRESRSTIAYIVVSKTIQAFAPLISYTFRPVAKERYNLCILCRRGGVCVNAIPASMKRLNQRSCYMLFEDAYSIHDNIYIPQCITVLNCTTLLLSNGNYFLAYVFRDDCILSCCRNGATCNVLLVNVDFV